MADENSNNSEQISSELSPKPRKVFRVPKDYGIPSSASILFRDVEMEQQFLNTFKSNGFLITRGGIFDQSNPNEFGEGNNSDISQRDADRKISEKVGTRMPETHSPQEVIESKQRFVAKIPDAQRGESKFLLETKEQKLRFVAWALLANNISKLFIDGKLIDAKIKDIFAKVERGDFSDDLFDVEAFSRWIFEDYIETPGVFNTSLRVVVDGLGTIHYAQVARSDNPKDAYSLPTSQPLPTDELNLWGKDLAIFLEHPDSPFYIRPKSFVSNIARGGKPILLDGNPVEEDTNKKVLEDLGIDPSNPQIPINLQPIASEIGRLSRGNYPFVGIDFLKSKNTGELILLEINAGPHLRPEGLRLPASTSDTDCDLELLRRILNSPSLA